MTPKIEKEADDLYEEVENIEGEEGQWVVIRNGKTVKRGYDSEEMYRFAAQFNPEEITITKLLYAGACFY